MNSSSPFATLEPAPCDPCALHELIASRAQDIWFRLGRPVGLDLDIWLEAEAEIQATLHKVLRHPHMPPCERD